MRLTKSHFLTYLESPLHLWAEVNNQTEGKGFSVFDQMVAKQGYQVEKLAKEFLTKKVKDQYSPGSTIQFQAVLIDGNFESRIDALVHDVVHDTYDLYEIKSSTSIDKQNKYDVTFQHLIGKSQLPVNKTYLVHVNGEYIKDGEIDLNEFFHIEDMSDVIGKLEDEVFELRSLAFDVLSHPKPPIEDHCYKPKDCPCKQLCHPGLPDYSIYDLCWWKVGQYEKLVANGYLDLTDVPETEELNPKQIIQLRSTKQKQPIIDLEGIKRELGNLSYPLYFLDYESINPAIPEHNNYHPYQHIVFQYSLHVVRSPDDKDIEHYEFLSTDKQEPSKQLVDSLLTNIGDVGSVIVWHKTFECGRNDELSTLQPLAADALSSINDRVYDLKEIFSKAVYVDYRFKGSASIKKVLPVLVPELSYDGMEIGEGATAMTKWWEMINGAEDGEEIKKNLLKYCELDTWAMVKIWKKLQFISKSH